MRVHDWEIRFVETMNQVQSREFDWIGFNCLHRAAAVVCALRGDDFNLPEIPSLIDESSAEMALVATGSDTLGGYLATLFDEVPVVMAQRGDLGVVGRSIVVCTGMYWSAFTEAGSVKLDRSSVQRAFRV